MKIQMHARIFTDSVSFMDISMFRVEGMQVTITPGWKYKPCDVAVMYGLANPPRRSQQGRLRNAIYREHNGPIVVIESSLIGRSFNQRLPGWLAALRRRPLRPRQVHPYYRVAVGGALGDDADFCAENSPPDRWERAKAEFGIRLKPYRAEGDYILLVGQVPKDASLRGIDMVRWLHETAAAIRKISDRSILIRLHPSTRWRDQEAIVHACSTVPRVAISRGRRPFADEVANAWVCVTLSSGAAIDALIAGVPPICLSPASLAYRLCSNSLDDIEHPKKPEREQFMRDLCHSQWTPREMSDGTAWRHIFPAVEREMARTGGDSGEHGAGRSRFIWAVQADHQGHHRPETVLSASEKQRWARSLALWTVAARILPGKRKRYLHRRATALFMLGRYGEAELVFEELRSRNPDFPGGHEGAARSAEKLDHWGIAAEAWAAASRLAPGRKALAGHAAALLKLGRLAEAEAAFGQLCERFPAEIAGYRGLERIASERGDWPLALQMQDVIWKTLSDPDAMRRKVLLLVRLQRIAEAKEIVKELEAGSSPLAYLLASMPLLEATHDWATMSQLLGTNEALLLGNWQLLHSYLGVLGRLGRADEALDVLDRSRAGKEAARKKLRINCLIQAHRYFEAGECLRQIWEHGSIDEFSPELLSPMVSAAWEAGGPDLANVVLDRVDAEAPHTVAGELLRLSAIFQRTRLRSLNCLASSSESAFDQGPHIEQLVRDHLAHSPGSMGAESRRDAVRDICGIFVRLRSGHADFFPDPSFVLNEALEVATCIAEAFDELKPLSLIRLGDGEGCMLPYRPELEVFRETDREATQQTWWGGAAQVDDALEWQLKEAIRSADVVGLPDLDRTSRGILSNSLEALGDGGRNARGLLASIDFAAGNTSKQAVLTSCHIHQSLSFWGIWDVLLPRLGAVSLITCHAKLGGVLAQRHGITIETVHLVPPEHKYAAGFASIAGDAHYPHAFTRLRDRLSGQLRGRVFLISAGMLGKIYCMWIRQAGGIAIDIGSAADFWCGHDTRSVVDIVTYRSPAGVAEQVRDLASEHSRFARLLPLDTSAKLLLGNPA
ncbi:tetratricopeptide repeat protein [Mesorhizobium sp.]|uniref:tetratricopeptide repeat protein n=1 Tax=Mesorhizobium sp. TaxID=1871066 RepID=UPI000FE68F28|nr:tetratricopeptide repeat protein [Mesorhizobium sp.]RWQ68700.1 MAG: hypothetical protein EOS86_02955 [Mesorhizobium sp.]